MNKTLVLVLLGIACAQGTMFREMFSPNDDVEILNSHNFKKFVYNSPTGWLINFYSSLSNRSQEFAPTWKEFATDTASWRDLMRVGVFDCSSQGNNRICFMFHVFSYPSVLYFSENSVSEGSFNSGISISSLEPLDIIKQSIINQLVLSIHQSHGKELLKFPRSIIPTMDTNENKLFEGQKKNIRYVILVIEDYVRPLGAEMVLHFRRTPNVAFKRGSAVLLTEKQKQKIKSLPQIVITDRNNNVEIISEGINGTKSMKWVLTKYLKSKGIKPGVIIPKKLDQIPPKVEKKPKDTKYVLIRV